MQEDRVQPAPSCSHTAWSQPSTGACCPYHRLCTRHYTDSSTPMREHSTSIQPDVCIAYRSTQTFANLCCAWAFSDDGCRHCVVGTGTALVSCGAAAERFPATGLTIKVTSVGHPRWATKPAVWVHTGYLERCSSSTTLQLLSLIMPRQDVQQVVHAAVLWKSNCLCVSSKVRVHSPSLADTVRTACRALGQSMHVAGARDAVVCVISCGVLAQFCKHKSRQHSLL